MRVSPTFEQMVALVPAPAQPINWEALTGLFPQLKDLATTPQDPKHHGEGDVWTHTKLVCEALLTLPVYVSADSERQFVLFYGALFHDIAKPACTVQEPDGRITSAGHSKRGAVDTRIVLWKAGVPFLTRERICRIIANHQIPFFAIKGNRSGDTAEFIARKLSCELSILELTAIAEADILGRVCNDAQSILDDIELFREVAREDGCFDAPRAFPDAHTRLSYFRTKGAISPDFSFFQEVGSSVIVLSGLPASGKDTWVAANYPGLPVISFDDAREALGLKHGSNSGAAVHLAIDNAKALLRQKAPFIWNATHLSTQMRNKTLDLLFGYNAEVSLVYLENSEATIKSRNTKRDTTLTNGAIDKMLYRWEAPLPTEAHVVSYVTNFA